MDMFPPIGTRSGNSPSHDDEEYTEIRVNPEFASPAPAPVYPLQHSEEEESDPEEEESDPEEDPESDNNGVQPMSESSESDDAPMNVRARTPTPPRYFRQILSTSGPRMIRTARKSVRLPSTAPASTSRAPQHTLASPPQLTAEMRADIAQMYATPSASLSRHSSPAAHSSPFTASASPVESPAHADPALSLLMQRLDRMESDIQQMRGSLTNLSGPSNLGDYQRQLNRHERRLDDLTRAMESHTTRLDATTHRAHTAHNRVFALGGLSDQCQRLQRMRDEDMAEIRRMRRRVYDLEVMMENLRI